MHKEGSRNQLNIVPKTKRHWQRREALVLGDQEAGQRRYCRGRDEPLCANLAYRQENDISLRAVGAADPVAVDVFVLPIICSDFSLEELITWSERARDTLH